MIDMSKISPQGYGVPYQVPGMLGASGGQGGAPGQTSVTRPPSYETPTMSAGGAGQTPMRMDDRQPGGYTQPPSGYLGAGTGGNATGLQQDPWASVQSYYPQYGQQQSFNNYPSQWGTASNTLTGFTNGQYNTNVPSQWGTASDYATNYLQNGQTASAAPAYQAAKAAAQFDIEDAIKQAAETAGMGGIRYSSPMAANAQRIAASTMAGLGANYAQNELQSAQQLEQNKLGILNNLYGLGQGEAGLTQQNALNALTASGMLGGLGQQYANLPMQAAQTASGIGNSLYGQYSGIPAAQQQNWAQQQSYNNPWLQYAGNYTQNSNMIPQQYSPGFGSQLLGLLGGLAGPAAYLLK
jgi:hypothetical protein